MKLLSTALVKAQKEFAPALKSSINPHFKSKYVGLDGCVEAVIDALNKNGIFLTQKTSMCDDGVIVETVFLHESGESVSMGQLHVPASKQDAQGYGSCLTYARRYSLMAACGIAPEDDDGNQATKSPKAPAQPVKYIDEFQIANIESLMKETKTDTLKFFMFLNVKQLSDVPLSDYDKAITALEKKRVQVASVEIPKL